MFRLMAKSKIQNATVTTKRLYYEGSIGIDGQIMAAADLLPDEMVLVVNVNNGQRLETYVIEEPHGSGTIALYGPAARCAEIGDVLHVISYCSMTEEEAGANQMKVVALGEDNKIEEQR